MGTFIIYQIQNTINGKCYIGQTTRSIKRRLNEHLQNWKHSSLIHKALKKYGIDNFVCTQLDTATNINDLNQKECYWIATKNTLSPNGYNLKTGGRRGVLCKESRQKISKTLLGRKLGSPSEVTRERMSKAQKGLPKPYLKGKPRSEETRRKISESNKGKKRTPEQRKTLSEAFKGRKLSKEHIELIRKRSSGKNSPMFGKKRSLETRKKISIGNKGKKLCPKQVAKKSYKIILNGVILFPSIKECARVLNIPFSSITHAVKHGSTYKNQFIFKRLYAD